MTVKAARVRLFHSRILFVRAYRRETQEMVFDAHDRAFVLFIGLMTDPISATSRQFTKKESSISWGRALRTRAKYHRLLVSK